MPTTIDQYREAKTQYLKLRNQAKKELITRFHELSNELLRIQRELLEDFGEKIAITNKPKKTRARAGVAETPDAPVKSAGSEAKSGGSQDPKIAAIRKAIERQGKKIADLQAAGKSTKTAQDRLYELEDELRLKNG
jgi:hypothetical protein